MGFMVEDVRFRVGLHHLELFEHLPVAQFLTNSNRNPNPEIFNPTPERREKVVR